jgi:hypothetical protein
MGRQVALWLVCAQTRHRLLCCVGVGVSTAAKLPLLVADVRLGHRARRRLYGPRGGAQGVGARLIRRPS